MTTKMTWEKLLSEKRPNQCFSKKEDTEVSKFGINNPFEEDYYTIINNSYFRRLKDKTQIFTRDSNDSVRNRLTHSLEVSSIGEIIGIKLSERLKNSVYKDDIKDCEIEKKLPLILKCAGLLHDIGNPPFGHAGEEYIRKFFEEIFIVKKSEEQTKTEEQPEITSFYILENEQLKNDLMNFEGNAQGLRIATKLGKSFYDNGKKSNYGMNLTCAVLSSIIKYPVSSNEIPIEIDEKGKEKKGKMGYYFSEEWIVKKAISKETGTFDMVNNKILKNPIMLLMEAADDIAYATADYEDGVRKGRIKVSDNDNIETIEGRTQKLRSEAVEDVVNRFIDHYEAIMNGEDGVQLISKTSKIEEYKEKNKILYGDRDIKNDKILDSKIRIREILIELIKILKAKNLTLTRFLIKKDLMQYIEKVDRTDRKMLKAHNNNIKEDDIDNYCDYLIVTDFVSGMTDGYVEKFWNKLYDTEYREAKEYIMMLPKRIAEVESKYEANEIYKELGLLSCVICEDEVDLNKEKISSDDIISYYNIGSILRECCCNEYMFIIPEEEKNHIAGLVDKYDKCGDKYKLFGNKNKAIKQCKNCQYRKAHENSCKGCVDHYDYCYMMNLMI